MEVRPRLIDLDASRVSCNFYFFLDVTLFFFLDVTFSFCEGPKEQTPQEHLAEDENLKE